MSASRMGRVFLFCVVLLVVAMGGLAYEAHRGQLDAWALGGVTGWLILAAVIGAIGYRVTRKQGDA